MSKFKGRFNKKYQDRVGHWPKHSFLTESSINIANVLNEKNLLKDGMNIFEMGSGGCRNFKYMNDINENLNFYANDLYEEASFKNMHESIKDKVTFYEKDTLELVQTFIPDYKIDVLVAAGHFMHIDPDSIKEIIEIIQIYFQFLYFLLFPPLYNILFFDGELLGMIKYLILEQEK